MRSAQGRGEGGPSDCSPSPACPWGRPTADADLVVPSTWPAPRWTSGGRAARPPARVGNRRVSRDQRLISQGWDVLSPSLLRRRQRLPSITHPYSSGSVRSESCGRPRMLHGQRIALPGAVGDGCIHPQAPGKRWSMGGGPAGCSLSTAAGGGQTGASCWLGAGDAGVLLLFVDAAKRKTGLSPRPCLVEFFDHRRDGCDQRRQGRDDGRQIFQHRCEDLLRAFFHSAFLSARGY